MQENKYKALFKDKKLPAIGVLYLTGDDITARANEEFNIYEEEGLDGAVIQSFPGKHADALRVLKGLEKRRRKIAYGVNILQNEFQLAYRYASQFGAKFIQLQYAAGRYVQATSGIDTSFFWERAKNQDIAVLGGVHPKGFTPLPGSSLIQDLNKAISCTDAVVVAPSDSSQITRLKTFAGEHPLVVDEGITIENAYQSLRSANGVILGLLFKPGKDISRRVDKKKVQDLMSAVEKLNKR